jgi:lipoprotein NlpD
MEFFKWFLSLVFFVFLLSGCMPSTFGTYHTIGKGQTLWRISQAYGVELQDLAELNNILDPTKVKTGQKIFIPGAFRAKRIETYQQSRGTRNNRSNYSSKNEVAKSGIIKVEKGRFIWPVKGVIVKAFGVREGYRNNGLDIKVEGKSHVLASDDGEVIYANTNLKGYGKTIIIKHKGGFTTVYTYHQENMVKIGEYVKKGDQIAKLGNFGPRNKYTAHFEIRKDRKPRNPLFFLP